ncbi:MAG: hypothetical protein F6K31_25735 [Symploca sp. SIO2G7]|nr:hypothetical protein [Symploca sp. SIO2G7]
MSIKAINSNTETVKSYHCCLLPVASLHKSVFNLVQDLSLTCYLLLVTCYLLLILPSPKYEVGF